MTKAEKTVLTNKQKQVYNAHLFGTINYQVAKDVIYEINKANSESEKYSHILLNTCSGGGDFFPSFAIFDAVKNSKLPVDFLATGWTASCAVMIMQAARRRYATENTYIMIHPSINAVSTKSHEEFMACAKQYDLEHQRFVKLSSERVGISSEEFDAITKKQMRVYMTAEEALKFGKNGFIDEIIQKP